MGVETSQPVITDKSREYTLTNEGGVCNTIRLLKNIGGLWVIQECRRTWASEGQVLCLREITRLASSALPFTAFIHPDAKEFMAPGDMPTRIREFCVRTGQKPPEDKGTIARLVFESLACKYRWTLERLEELAGHRLDTLHIVGGGSQNRLLNQFTADAIGRPVVAGPVEATAAGNALMQLLALGRLARLRRAGVIRHSFGTETFVPRETSRWDEAYARYRDLLAAAG